MTTFSNLNRAFGWLALIATMLYTTSAHAQARMKFRFAGEIAQTPLADAAIQDPEDIFNSTLQDGSPISGELSFSLPYFNHFDMALQFNGVPVTMNRHPYFDPLYASPGFPFYWTLFPSDVFGYGYFDFSVWANLAHPAEFRPPPTDSYYEGQFYFALADFTGQYLNVWDILELPFGNFPLDDLPFDQSAFAGFGSYNISDGWSWPANFSFRMKTFESSIVGDTGFYIWPPRYERFTPGPSGEYNDIVDDGVDYEVGELDGSAIVTVRRIGDLTGTSTVNYSTADGSAAAGVNYTATSGTLTFAPGETEQSFAVEVLDDNVRTANTTLTVQFSGAVVASADPFSTVIRVLEKNPFPYLSIAEMTYSGTHV